MKVLGIEAGILANKYLYFVYISTSLLHSFAFMGFVLSSYPTFPLQNSILTQACIPINGPVLFTHSFVTKSHFLIVDDFIQVKEKSADTNSYNGMND